MRPKTYSVVRIISVKEIITLVHVSKTYSVVRIVSVKEIIALETKNSLGTVSFSKAFSLQDSL